MEPSQKSPEMESALNFLFGKNRRQTIQGNTCMSCSKPATSFRNAISQKEYTISGLCQACQDSVFGED